MRRRVFLSLALAAATGLLLQSTTTPRAMPVAKRPCPDINRTQVEVIRLERKLGCHKGGKLAVRTVKKDGFLQTERYYCRWGQGGTQPVHVNGRTYFGGFCFDSRTEKEAAFLGRQR